MIAQEDPARIQLMQWGLVPSWSRDRQEAERIRKGTYNARSESLHEKPSFREALNRGRCLVIAGGFFEWQLADGVKVPWYIRLKNETPFAFAGLFDTWRDPLDGEVLKSCTIITTRANPLMEKIHNTKKRMPVILPVEKETEWISGEPSLLRRNQLLVPCNDDDLKAHTVSTRLSSPGADPADPGIIEPVQQLSSGKLF